MPDVLQASEEEEQEDVLQRGVIRSSGRKGGRLGGFLRSSGPEDRRWEVLRSSTPKIEEPPHLRRCLTSVPLAEFPTKGHSSLSLYTYIYIYVSYCIYIYIYIHMYIATCCSSLLQRRNQSPPYFASSLGLMSYKSAPRRIPYERRYLSLSPSLSLSIHIYTCIIYIYIYIYICNMLQFITTRNSGENAKRRRFLSARDAFRRIAGSRAHMTTRCEFKEVRFLKVRGPPGNSTTGRSQWGTF